MKLPFTIKSAEDFVEQQAQHFVNGLDRRQPNYVKADGTTTFLEGDQAKATLDRNWQLANPAQAALFRYREEMPENTLAYKAGLGLRNWAVKRPIPRQGGQGFFGTSNPWSGALAAGIPAALLGLGLGYAADKFGGNGESYWTPRLAAGMGTLGAGLGAYTGYWRNKSASYWKSEDHEPQEDIVQLMDRAPGLSYQQKTILSNGVRQLNDAQASQLLRLLLTSGGFGVGALIAKFLMGAGLQGTLIGGLAGGLVGNIFAPRPAVDALGRNSFGRNDMFGNPLF